MNQRMRGTLFGCVFGGVLAIAVIMVEIVLFPTMTTAQTMLMWLIVAALIWFVAYLLHRREQD